MTTDPHTRLLDIEAIKAVKSRYCRFIDTKCWERLQELFTPGVRFEGFASAPSGSDGAAFIRGVSSRLQDAITMHHCHAPDIEFADDTHAHVVWAMQDYMEWPQPIGYPGHPAARGMHGFGFYEEDYRKDGGIWRLSHLRLVRTRLMALPDTHPPFPEGRS